MNVKETRENKGGERGTEFQKWINKKRYMKKKSTEGMSVWGAAALLLRGQKSSSSKKVHQARAAFIAQLG